MNPSAPVSLGASHAIDAFDCGEPSLDEWLRRRALANQASGASRTYVTCVEGQVVGYCALASGGVTAAVAPTRFRRNMPDPVPVVLLGRLAVDVKMQGRGLGRALFRDAGLRVLNAAEILGIRGLLVRGLTESARDFCTALGMDPSPHDPMTLLITLSDLRDALDTPD